MYLFLPLYDTLGSWFAFFAGGGKSLTSRVRIWTEIETNLLPSALLGQYDLFFESQMHNALGTLLLQFGALFTAIVCQKFYGAVKKLDSAVAQLPLCAAWIVGCFETAFFTGMAGVYLLILVLPLISDNGRPPK